MSPISLTTPSTDWKSLLDVPYNTRSDDRAPQRYLEAGHRSDCDSIESDDNFITQGSRASIAYNVKVWSNGREESKGGLGAERSASVNVTLPKAAVLPTTRDDSTQMFDLRASTPSLSLSQRPSTAGSQAHDFLRPPSFQRPIVRMGSLDRMMQ
jgi:hypothetical protein